MRALKNVTEVQLDNIPNLKKCVLLTAFKCVESVKATNASLLGDMKQLKEVKGKKEDKPRVPPPPYRREGGGIESQADWLALSDTMTYIEIGDEKCNEEGFEVLDFGRFHNLKEVHIGSDCFEEVEKVKFIGLKCLERIVIGENSFTKKKKTWPKEINHDRQFFLKDCPAMVKVRIDNYSFSDYSICEMEQLPSLEDIEIGDLKPENSCFCFYFASLELKSGYDERL